MKRKEVKLENGDLVKYVGKGFATFDKENTTMTFLRYGALMHDIWVEYKGMELLVWEYEVKPIANIVIHKQCGTKSTVGTYEDGLIDYHCKKCDVTFKDDEQQSTVS